MNRCHLRYRYFLGLGLLLLGPAELEAQPASSSVAQCSVRLTIEEPPSTATVDTGQERVTMQGRGEQAPFLLIIDGEPEATVPVVAGCFDLELRATTQRSPADGPVTMWVEPL